MLIGKIKRDPKRNLTLSIHESLTVRIERYLDLYETTYGERIDRSELVERLIVATLDRDRSFRRYEREQAKAVQGSKSAPDSASS